MLTVLFFSIFSAIPLNDSSKFWVRWRFCLVKPKFCWVWSRFWADLAQFYALVAIKTRSSQMRPDKTMPDEARRIQTKFCWFYLASWTRSLPNTWRKLTRLCQTTPDSVFFCKHRNILVLSGTSFRQTSSPGRQIEPAIFCLAPSGYDLFWSSWCGCTQYIIIVV